MKMSTSVKSHDKIPQLSLTKEVYCHNNQLFGDKRLLIKPNSEEKNTLELHFDLQKFKKSSFKMPYTFKLFILKIKKNSK